MSLKNNNVQENNNTQNNSIFRNGIHWFYRLKGDNGLLANMTDEERVYHLIVSFINPEGIRFFTSFDSYIKFIQFMLTIPEQKRNFHEVTLENRHQKMRFDIDIKRISDAGIVPFYQVQSFLDDLITSCIQEFEEIGIKLTPEKNFLVFSSHGREKWSFHIIIDGFYCENNRECIELFKRITTRMKSQYIYWLDSGIYSPNHCLRILGSCKEDEEEIRKKKLETSWQYLDKEIKYEYSQEVKSDKHKIVLEFERSFLSLTENCYPIPNLIQQVLMDGMTEVKDNKSLELDEQIMDYAFRVFKSTFGDMCSYVSTMSNMIMLKRNYPSGCPICDRVHEADNAYLLVKESADTKNTTSTSSIKKYDILFDCRRANGKKMKIGEKIILCEPTEVKNEKVNEEPPKPTVKTVTQKSSRSGFRLEDMEYVSKTSLKYLK